LRIVSIGGGHGLSTLLRGLKEYAWKDGGKVDITAVVTVTDDGGSSGRLRRDLAVLPPGDIRNCMVALSQDEALLARLFDYRFAGGRGLKGHSFGNLFLTAMSHLTGDFAQAVALCSEVLAVAGRVYPSTASNVELVATMASGRLVRGETRISRSMERIEQIRLEPASVQPCGETLEAIAAADLITIGPGSLYTSLIPHFLVDGIPRAIRASRATTVYFANLMTQPGETTGMTASDHISAILRHCGRDGAGLIDICLANSARLAPAAVKQYRERSARPVELDRKTIEGMGIQVLEADLARRLEHAPVRKIRHDPAAIAAVTVDLAAQARERTGRRRAS
jgi:uncharacterized cofD-like protein